MQPMRISEKGQRSPSETCRQVRGLVAQNIRFFASFRQLSLNQLADASGVSRAQMYNVLNGGSSPSIDWLTKVAPALGVEPWQLLVIHLPREANPDSHRPWESRPEYALAGEF